jgi:hypothetical protein
VKRGHDDPVVVVLNVRERRLDMLFVMVVNERDRASDVRLTQVLPMFHQLRPNHVCHGQGAIIVALLVNHLVELPGQLSRQRNAETNHDQKEGARTPRTPGRGTAKRPSREARQAAPDGRVLSGWASGLEIRGF